MVSSCRSCLYNFFVYIFPLPQPPPGIIVRTGDSDSDDGHEEDLDLPPPPNIALPPPPPSPGSSDRPGTNPDCSICFAAPSVVRFAGRNCAHGFCDECAKFSLEAIMNADQVCCLWVCASVCVCDALMRCVCVWMCACVFGSGIVASICHFSILLTTSTCPIPQHHTFTPTIPHQPQPLSFRRGARGAWRRTRMTRGRRRSGATSRAESSSVWRSGRCLATTLPSGLCTSRFSRPLLPARYRGFRANGRGGGG